MPTQNVSLEEVKWMSSSLAAKVVDPRQLYFDPEHSYIIEESMTSLPEVQALSKVKMPDGSFYYDPIQVKKLKNTDYSEDSKEIERLQKLGLYTGQNEFKKRVHLYEYWGPVYNRKGEVLKKNARVVLANKLYVLNTSNIENPMRFYGPLYGKPPYVIFSPIDYLFRLEGQSLIEGAVSLQKAINDITNMSLDGLLWKLLKLFEVNPDRLRNPEILTKLRPGSPILVSGEGRAINEVPISDIPRGSFAEVEILRRALQNSDLITDFALALETKKTTATEYEGANKQTDSMFESIGRNLEEGLIEPAVEMARQLIIQFWDDFNDPALQKMAGQFGLPFAATTREERIAFMLKTSWVQARGISSYFEKMAKLKKMIDFFGVAGKIPPLLEQLELREWANRIIDCFSFERPYELVVTEQESQMIKMQHEQEKKAKMDNLEMQKQAFDMKKMEAQAKAQQIGGGQSQGALPPPNPVMPVPPGGMMPSPTGGMPLPQGGNGGGVTPQAILSALMAQRQGGNRPQMPMNIPGRAEGGGVLSGSPYIVGEQGPELFVPGQTGTIVSNKAILNQHKDKEFVQRLLNPENYPIIPMGEDSYATHQMSWGQVGDKYVVFPTIVNQNGKLIQLDPKSAMNFAISNQEYIPFNTPEDADYFSQHYKEGWGMKQLNRMTNQWETVQ
jgi:hypothetical protein